MHMFNYANMRRPYLNNQLNTHISSVGDSDFHGFEILKLKYVYWNTFIVV